MTMALFTIGAGELILILFLLLILVLFALGFAAVIYLIVRAVTGRSSAAALQISDEAQQRRDLDHLNLASIFHFVFAGLAVLGIAFLAVHYTILHTVFTNPEMWKGQKHPPPKAFFDVFIWMYLFGGVIFIAGGVLNVMSGMFIRRRTNRTFSLVIAALDCLQIPFGTALGVFTMLLLSRPGVRQLYGEIPKGVSNP
jgi:hypothetical protein